MKQSSHVNVTVDFTNWGGEQIDLRIPIQQTVKQLIQSLEQTLKIKRAMQSLFIIKITTKNLLITDEDVLADYPITNGDLLILY